MLRITIPELESWDEQSNEFIQHQGRVLELEHSLSAIRKWESKWKKPFFSNKDREGGVEKTIEETRDYILCMITNHDVVDPSIVFRLSETDYDMIGNFMKDPMTATWFNEVSEQQGSKSSVVTAEIIYYWMVAQTIPFECQHWHINQLLTLLKVCGEKNKPPDKKGRRRNRRENIRKHAAINRARRAQYEGSS